MMIDDEQRREVAARLRNFEQLRGVFRVSNVCAFCDVLGVGYMDWEHICARLADLIDRPKAKREDAGNYWLCKHCGAFSRKDAVTDCCGVIPSRCCGNCGREWER